MGLFSRTPAQQSARELRAEHNRRFNRRDADPNSREYLESHDRVVAAEKAAKKRR